MRAMRLGKMLGLVILSGVAMVGLNGCDYWPPALQAQIEQLRAEAQATAAERAKLESQFMEIAKLKDGLQARVDELTRLNRELAGRVAGLEQSLTEAKSKGAKVAKGPAKSTGKASDKPAAKTQAKKSAKGQPKKQ